MKISLCLIVGNVDEYIARCLESFLPIADEVILVRAIGCLAPDATLDLARLAVQRHNDATGRRVLLKTDDYRNAPAHADWPHVDNFAAARQMSFDLATGDYCFWCDTDDILVSGAEKIRQHAEQGRFACFMFPYDIFGKNTIIYRDRMILRGAATWKHAVHECLKYAVEPVTSALDDGVVIQHLPRLDKGERELAAGGATGNQRNLRILESLQPEELSPGLKYHLFGELVCAGRRDEAIRLALELLQDKELGKDERYDLLMALYLHTTDLQQRVDLAHEAHKTDPERREALGVLACTMMDLGKPVAALAYARQMMGTTAPEEHSWNSRRNFYGHVGDDIFQQALRVNGRLLEAESVRLASLKRHGGPRIALLHATRGRPDQAARCRKAWHDLAVEPGRVEHIFAIDEDDADSRVLRRFNHVLVPPGGGCVRAWNYAADRTSSPIVIQLSDDWIPLPKWDELICERMGDVNRPSVLAISDGHRNDQLLCMAICTRMYLIQDYFLFHPFFTGVYSDNWFTEKAYARGQVIEARDLVFKHLHPAFGTAPMDEGYARQNAPERYAEGLAVLDRLRAGMDWSAIPGFFNFIGLYEQMAAQLKDGDTVAEIGVWQGRSLIFLAQCLQRLGKRNVKLIAVDTFRGEENQPAHYSAVAEAGGSLRATFEKHLRQCGVVDMVKIIEGDSAASAAQVADASLAFCFIDAAHDYESVKRDLQAWRPKVKPDGILAGHDILHEPVARAVKELLPGAKQHTYCWLHLP